MCRALVWGVGGGAADEVRRDAAGDDVTAYVRDRGLYLQGEGEVAEFAADAPWTEYDDEMDGAYLPRAVKVSASVAATLPISVEGGSGDPSGAITPAGAESIEIADGKVYLGVSVATNADLSAATETWQKADIEDIRKESDGTVTLTVPAPADKGFMILKSKPAGK